MNELRIGRSVPNGTTDSVDLAVTVLPLPGWLVEGKKQRAFHLDLPMPPSVNDMFANNFSGNGRGRVKTHKYQDWITEAGYGAKWPQGYEDWHGVVLLYVDCGRMKAGRDVDNCIKPVQDLAASMMGVNDSCFHWAAAFRSEDHGIAAGRVGVTLVLVEG